MFISAPKIQRVQQEADYTGPAVIMCCFSNAKTTQTLDVALKMVTCSMGDWVMCSAVRSNLTTCSGGLKQGCISDVRSHVWT